MGAESTVALGDHEMRRVVGWLQTPRFSKQMTVWTTPCGSSEAGSLGNLTISTVADFRFEQYGFVTRHHKTSSGDCCGHRPVDSACAPGRLGDIVNR